MWTSALRLDVRLSASIHKVDRTLSSAWTKSWRCNSTLVRTAGTLSSRKADGGLCPGGEADVRRNFVSVVSRRCLGGVLAVSRRCLGGVSTDKEENFLENKKELKKKEKNGSSSKKYETK
jgi:hypothetical protein